MKSEKSKEYDIRAVVVHWLLSNGFERAQIRHEITLDTASSKGRTDLLLLAPNALIAVELKSGSDKLDRLKDQEAAGEMAADYFWIFADTRHEKGLPWTKTRFLVAGEEVRNGFCGKDLACIVWSNGVPHQTGYGGGRSTTTTPRRMASLLWKSETDWLALACEIPQGPRCKVIAAIQEQESLSSIRGIVTDLLKKRPLSKWEQSFWERFDAEQVSEVAA